MFDEYNNYDVSVLGASLSTTGRLWERITQLRK